MKRIILVTIIILFAITAYGQVNKDDLAITQSYFRKSKTEVVKENLKISDAQGQKFWPIYEAYEDKRGKLSNERAAIINDYLKQFNTLTEQEAETLIMRTLSNDKSFTSLQKSYVKKFASAVGGKNTAKFYQLETYLHELLRLSIQDEIPFIGELNKHKRKS